MADSQLLNGQIVSHSRILASPAPTSCRATPPKPRRPIRISSRYGRMKDADLDIPILIAAKAEYAKLQ